MMDNTEQIKAIDRYRHHKLRNGLDAEFEQVAREWISKYAKLWRRHRTASPAISRAV